METKEEEVFELCEENQMAHHIGYQLKIIDRMFRRSMEAMMRKNGVEDMSMTNAWIIDYLAHNEGKDVYQKDIEKRFKIGRSSVAGILKMMEEKGYIVRQAVEGDARLKRVCLTDKGRACKHKMKEGREKMEEEVRKGLTEEEIEMFLNVLRKMQENLMDI